MARPGATETAPRPSGADDWRQVMRQAIRDPHELCRRLELPSSWADRALSAVGDFPLFAPRCFVDRIRVGDRSDPLLKQIMPVADEIASVPGFSHDPVDDLSSRVMPGVLQKYHGRALLVTTGACAVHCRYCFRRHFPYSESPSSLEQWLPAIRQLSADESIEEVILSGGDPLTIVDDVLEPLIERLDEIPQVRRLRVHTRLPIMIPQRVTDQLLRLLSDRAATVIVVVHVNHPQEIDNGVVGALERIRAQGLMMLNQAVLLRGINDRVDVLAELCFRLIDLGVTPYYLNQLDRVSGAAHFEVSIERGRKIMAELAERLPGYAMPRYVQDVPGDVSKRSLERDAAGFR